MSLWTCRDQSYSALAGSLQPLASLLGAPLLALTRQWSISKSFYRRTLAPTGRVCAAVTMKGRNLALGCYSLALDGLAQESGAILRPCSKSIELLEYLRDILGRSIRLSPVPFRELANGLG